MNKDTNPILSDISHIYWGDGEDTVNALDNIRTDLMNYPVPPTSDTMSYDVTDKDTLFSLSNKMGVHPDNVGELNNFRQVKPGQTISVPTTALINAYATPEDVPDSPPVWAPGDEEGNNVNIASIFAGLKAAQPDIESRRGQIGNTVRWSTNDFIPEGEERVLYSPRYPKDAQGNLIMQGPEHDEFLKQQDIYYRQQKLIRSGITKDILRHPMYKEMGEIKTKEFPAISRFFLHRSLLNLNEDQFNTQVRKQTTLFNSLSTEAQTILANNLGNPNTGLDTTLHVGIIPNKQGTMTKPVDTIAQQFDTSSPGAPAFGNTANIIERKRETPPTAGLFSFYPHDKYRKTEEEWGEEDSDLPIFITEIPYGVAVGHEGVGLAPDIIQHNKYPEPSFKSRTPGFGNNDGVALILMMNFWDDPAHVRDYGTDTLVHEGTHTMQESFGSYTKPHHERPHEQYADLMGAIMSFRSGLPKDDRVRPLTDEELGSLDNQTDFTDNLSPEIRDYLKKMIVYKQQKPTDMARA